MFVFDENTGSTIIQFVIDTQTVVAHVCALLESIVYRATKSSCARRRFSGYRSDFEAETQRPLCDLTRISHTHTKHRSPGDVKFYVRHKT